MKQSLKVLTIISLLLLQSKIFLGQINVSSRIIEDKTESPVPYANIWIKNLNIGTTSDDNGYFSIKVDSLTQYDSIIVSSIGFNDTLIQISKIKSILTLKPKIYQISEIAVFPKERKELILNDLSGNEFKGGIMNDTTPQIVGRYFPYNEETKDYIYVKSVVIYSRDSHKGKLNLRIYSFDTTNVRPIKELVMENLLVETKKSMFYKAKPVEIDLSKFNITFPKEGLFIGVEWLILPENRYDVTFSQNDSKKKVNKVMYAPNLCATIDKEGYQYQYRKGVWWKPFKRPKRPGYKYSECYYNPAITLKLSD